MRSAARRRRPESDHDARADSAAPRARSRLITGMLGELRVRCENAGRGCEWTGAWEALDAHEAACDKQETGPLLERVRELEEEGDGLKDEVEHGREMMRVGGRARMHTQRALPARHASTRTHARVRARTCSAWSGRTRSWRTR